MMSAIEGLLKRVSSTNPTIAAMTLDMRGNRFGSSFCASALCSWGE